MARADSGGAAEQDQKNYYDSPQQARAYASSANYNPNYQPWSTYSNQQKYGAVPTGTGYWAQPPAQQPPQANFNGNGWTPQSPPGYGELWYQKNAYRYDHPSSANQYWEGIQGNFANPSMYEQEQQRYANQLGNTTGPLENLWNQYNSSGEFSRPTAGESWWSQNGGQYNSPSAGENTLASAASQLGQTGSMEDWARQNGGFFTTSGDMEKFYGQNAGKLYNNNNLANAAGGIAGDINSARNAGAFFGATAGDLLSPSYAESLANNYQRMPSYNEQFLLGGGATQGLDSLYDRLYQKGSRALANEGAARGSFNSGASLRSAEELNADLSAQHVKDYMAASQAADVSRLADQNYGLNLAEGADTGRRGRIALGLSGANMADTNALARARGMQDLATGVSDELRNNLTTAGNWAQNSQTDALGRMTEGANVSNMANQDWLERMQNLTTAGNDQATQFLNRLNGGSEAASRATQDWATRMNQGYQYAHGAQQDWAARLKDAAGMNHDLQDEMMNRLLTGGTLATNADTGYWNALMQGQTAANSAQNMQQNRENNVFTNVNTLGKEQAGTYGQGTDQARNEQRQSLMDEINGLIAQGGITSQEIMGKYGAMMQALGLTIQGGKVVMGAATGNPGLMAGGGGMPTPGASDWSFQGSGNGDAGYVGEDGPYGKYGPYV